MHIIYEVCSAGSSHQNEDACGVNGNIAWVIDGATEMFYDHYISEQGDTVWTVNQINEALKRQQYQSSLSDMLYCAIKEVREKAEKINPDIRNLKKYELPSYAICMVVVQKSKLEYLILGDCSVMIKGRNTNIITDTRLQKFHEMVVRVKTRYSESCLYKEKVKDAAQKVRKQMNTEDGYWIGSLDESVSCHGVIGEVPIEKGEEILICSDGFWPSIEENNLVNFDFNEIFIPTRLSEILKEQRKQEAEFEKKTGNNISDDLTVFLIKNI